MAYISFQPHDYFNTKLYTGTGSAQSITGVGFQPDLIWGKNRSATWNHIFTDAVRGANKQISSNLTNAEESNTGEFTAFGSDGFSVGTGSTLNGSGNNICSWNWKANGQGSSNTDGSTASTVSVNITAGFSIVKWTGSGSATTIGHGLGVTPKIIMLKNTSEVYGWQVYHASLGNTKYLALDSTDASATSSQSWNNTSPTSTVFSVGASDSNNKSGNTIIAYCFAEKKGFSKFSSYTGNGSSSNSPFIYTGFKPAFIIIKKDATDYWFMYDNKRGDINANAKTLKANTSDAEGTSGKEIDFLSNGVKIRNSNNSINTSGSTYIYMVFAEEPLVASNGIPATAR